MTKPTANPAVAPVPDRAETEAAIARLVGERLRDVPDFPKPGVLFKDFTPLLGDGPALRALVDDIAARYAGRVDAVVGIEARGFILGAAVAYVLGVGFIPVRKAGKLPADTHEATYTLEYGTATLEIHVDALVAGHRVVIIDDVLATGGTAAATCDLVERAGGLVVAVEVVLEVGFLAGRSALPGREVHSVLVT